VSRVWLRRLLPASVVSVVLAFSYFAPVLGLDAPPVKSASPTNCGRFGYGYHGGKHQFICPSHEPQPAYQPQPAFQAAAPAARSQAFPATSQPAAAPVTRAVVSTPVSAGVTYWRAFIELVRRQLS
jgi:hypothetical protein